MANPRRIASDAAAEIGSLAINPGIGGAVIAVAGVSLAGVVGGFFLVRYIKRRILASQIRKHRAEIEAVNKLHEKYLSRIIVPGYEVKSFPHIFKLDPDITTDKAESLHL